MFDALTRGGADAALVAGILHDGVTTVRALKEAHDRAPSMPTQENLVSASNRWLEAVTEVAQVAGAVALRYFTQDVAVESKADGSPVTIADREAERSAREWIGRRFPDHAVLGEELGETPGTRRLPLAHRSDRRHQELRRGRAALGHAGRAARGRDGGGRGHPLRGRRAS